MRLNGDGTISITRRELERMKAASKPVWCRWCFKEHAPFLLCQPQVQARIAQDWEEDTIPELQAFAPVPDRDVDDPPAKGSDS